MGIYRSLILGMHDERVRSLFAKLGWEGNRGFESVHGIWHPCLQRISLIPYHIVYTSFDSKSIPWTQPE